MIDPRFLELPWGTTAQYVQTRVTDFLLVDFDVLVHGAKFIRKWIATEPIAGFVDKLVTPPESTSSLDDWEKFVRSVVRVRT